MAGMIETRSPARTPSTSGPTSTTRAENSCPSVCGRVTPVSGCGVTGVTIGPTVYSWRSVPQMPHQATSTRTSSPALMTGSGTSSSRMSALPWNRAARTVRSSSARRSVGSWFGVGATRAAVDDGRDDDQGALEEVLPGLRQIQEDGRVEHLDDEPGAEQGPDERAATAEQAGAAEHDGGDAAQGVAHALRRVADPELRQQD